MNPDSPILEVSGIGKRFGGIVAVDDVSFSLRRGIATGLIGPNGAGKTTVFDILTGFQKADEGEVRFDGTDITGLTSHRVSRLGIGRTFQSVRVFARLTVRENMAIAVSHGTDDSSDDISDRIDAALSFVEMSAHANAIAGSLSYGQRKLVELGMVLVQRPRLILLDEPVAGVNPGLIQRLSAILRNIIENGVSLLVVEHNIRFVTGLCEQIVVLAAAQKLTSGVPDEIMSDPAVLEAFLGSDH